MDEIQRLNIYEIIKNNDIRFNNTLKMIVQEVRQLIEVKLDSLIINQILKCLIIGDSEKKKD